MLRYRGIKSGWEVLGYSIRLALIYLIMERRVDFRYSMEYVPRILACLELGENLTPLIEELRGHVTELFAIVKGILPLSSNGL